MAPANDKFSAAGSASYNSDTMVVGDGTWDFTKNTFLLPNLASPNFDTMRYNGMANRFSTLTEYHSLILAHGVLAALAFLLLVPVSVMTARFYTGRPGFAVKYHAQMHIVAGLMVLTVFILGNLAVGPKRSLTNPHHGIGVAIFLLFILQLIGGRLVRHITKLRSLRITIHQWSGRAIALLGIVQVPLGLTLYGSPKYLFVLYTLWMIFLLLVYFILSYRSDGRRELYMGGGRSEAGRTRITESEYLGPDRKDRGRGWMGWLAPLAAGAGLWAFLRGRRKNKDEDRRRSRSRSRSRGPEVLPSRRGSGSYIEEEKYSALSPPRKSGGGFMKVLGGAAAAVGAGALASRFMNRRDRRRDDDYSAVSTETPRRHRPGRANQSVSEFTSNYTDDIGGRGPHTPGQTAAMAAAASAADPRLGSRRPVTPRPSYARHQSRRSFDDSDFASYVSPSRREPEDRHGGGGGVGKGILAGLGMGWFAKKLADRRSRKDDERLREEEEMRAGEHGPRFTGDGHPSPTRRPPVRRPTGFVHSEVTDSSIEARPPGGTYGPPIPPPQSVPMGPGAPGQMAPPMPVPVPVGHSRSWSRSRPGVDPVVMPPMPADPHGILHSEGESYGTSDARSRRRSSSRQRRAGERSAAAAAAAVGAGAFAAEEGRAHRDDRERERYGSPHSQPVSLKLKVHDDRDRNVTLRRLTEEEAMAARGSRPRADSESSLSGSGSPSYGRSRYRRDDTTQRRAEAAAERRVERDPLASLSPPNPAFAKSRRAKDSAYYSGQPGPSGATASAGQTVSSLGSLASPESHGTSNMSPSPGGPGDKLTGSAADNRRRRRLERRRGSSSRPTGSDMFD